MSITPIEGDGEPESASETDQRRRAGVSARVLAALGVVGSRLRSALQVFRPSTTESSSGHSADTAQTQLRVSGQHQLESSYQSDGDRSGENNEQLQGQPPSRGNLPGSADVTAEQRGESLRVYNPELPEAYISSDVWEDVER